MDYWEILLEGALNFGVSIDKFTVKQFMSYAEMLIEWNNKFNLTSIVGIKDIVIKHFLDSLSITPMLSNIKGKLIDIGTGAGFPGIPLRLVLDKPEILLIDSNGKKIKFLNHVIINLYLNNINAEKIRAEDMGKDKNNREIYDAAVIRAVSILPVILEYSLPLVKCGGSFIAMKGKIDDEIKWSQRALSELGGKIEDIRNIILPFSDYERTIIIIRKVRQTSPKYPRKAGKPTKNPII